MFCGIDENKELNKLNGIIINMSLDKRRYLEKDIKKLILDKYKFILKEFDIENMNNFFEFYFSNFQTEMMDVFFEINICASRDKSSN